MYFRLFAFFLVVANLRPSLTSVGPLLDSIRTDLGLSAATAGMLTTLPLIAFAVAAPFARFGRTFGIERTLAGCIVVTICGIVLRSQGSEEALFAGTLVFASAIGVANVLVPSLVKRDFPENVGAMTTSYVVVMSVAGALASGLAVPLAQRFDGGWRPALAIWAFLGVLALVCWLPQARRTRVSAGAAVALGTKARPVWRSALAWQVTAFMGLQSMIFYVLISWMPQFLVDHGTSPEMAGWWVTLFQIVGLGTGLLTPALIRRGRDQRLLSVVVSLATSLAILGLVLAPRFAGMWLLGLGASTGVTVILAFTMIGMRSSDHHRAASVSMMAQAAGYLIAAAGPVAFGWLHDVGGNWSAPMTALSVVALMQAGAGFGSGRNSQI